MTRNKLMHPEDKDELIIKKRRYNKTGINPLSGLESDRGFFILYKD